MTENEWEWKRGQNVWVLVGVSKDWAEAKGKEEEGERESKKRPVTMPVRDEAYNVAAPCTANSHR